MSPPAPGVDPGAGVQFERMNELNADAYGARSSGADLRGSRDVYRFFRAVPVVVAG